MALSWQFGTSDFDDTIFASIPRKVSFIENKNLTAIASTRITPLFFFTSFFSYDNRVVICASGIESYYNNCCSLRHHLYDFFGQTFEFTRQDDQRGRALAAGGEK